MYYTHRQLVVCLPMAVNPTALAGNVCENLQLVVRNDVNSWTINVEAVDCVYFALGLSLQRH